MVHGGTAAGPRSVQKAHSCHVAYFIIIVMLFVLSCVIFPPVLEGELRPCLPSPSPSSIQVVLSPAWGLRCQTIHWSGALCCGWGLSDGTIHSTAVKGRSSTRSLVGLAPAAPTWACERVST